MGNQPENQAASKTENLFHSLLRTFGQVRHVMDPYFLRLGISASQWGVLRVLHRAELQGRKMLGLTDLGQRLLIQPPSVTGIVDRLERQGLVNRDLTQADRRTRQVSLTPQGRSLVTKALAGHADQIEILFAGLTKQEQQDMRRLLGKLQTHLAALAPQQNKRGGMTSDSPANA
jgi:MarR family 2-MHQ and catechol resistance regulon transcriptional repressor